MPPTISKRPRTSKRSKTGCSECRRRKIKCDEEQPQCGQCLRRRRTCTLQDSQFRHVFPIQQGSSRVGADIQSDATAKKASDTRNTGATIIRDSNAASANPANERVTRRLASRENQLQGVQSARKTPAEDRRPASGGSEAPRTLNDHDSFGDSDSFITLPASSHDDPAIESTEVLENKQEELYLLRHYAECIGPWMDLLYRYEVFSREVLTLARDHPVLRYAACAVAAKQLGQMGRTVNGIVRSNTQAALARRLARAQPGVGWYGAKYYEKAIQTLVKSITPTDTIPEYIYPPVSLSQGNLMIQADREDPVVRLLATCILIQYEQLSTSRDAWSGHLTGFSKLLDLIGDGILLRPNPRFQAVYPFTKDVMHIKAGFWNFVVNDLEESFVSHAQTRIDTENLALWRNMGLLIEDDGGLALDDTPNGLATTPEHARDKVLSYTLIRLMCKLIDFLAPSSQTDSYMQHLSSSELQRRKAAFISLESQFELWYKSLSLSFHADGTFLTERDSKDSAPTLFSRELWYSNDLCSTTMLYYHMARILLLIHRPRDLLPTSAENSAAFDLLHMLREMEQKLQLHASDIFSIVCAKPSDAVRLRAIQPLPPTKVGRFGEFGLIATELDQ
ncbi:hypothetical protein ONZ43_g4333 [Nemania bipapillata]|uniref:Uncharacterized protein n=1 Tax=Nemania bipapillata TaxID=110536 RepID=A0ACC2IP41_9PEZI|nr:hypothetical protein ONZ43_g4333 [Nemania bipapillata]